MKIKLSRKVNLLLLICIVIKEFWFEQKINNLLRNLLLSSKIRLG